MFFVCLFVFFAAGAGHVSGMPVLRGTAFCRAFGTAGFLLGGSMLVVLRNPAILVEAHIGPSVRAGCLKSAESSGCCAHA